MRGRSGRGRHATQAAATPPVAAVRARAGEHAVHGGREVGRGVRKGTVKVEQHQPDHRRRFERLRRASCLSGLAQRDEVVDVRVRAKPGGLGEWVVLKADQFVQDEPGLASVTRSIRSA